jgi:hypothetical protein
MLMTKSEREIQRKLRVLKHAEKIGDVSRACRYFGIGRASFFVGNQPTNGTVSLGWSTARPA